MPNLNRVLILGHLGHAPEPRVTPKGTQVVNLRIATTKRWKDPASSERKERTEWHRVVVFGKQAEFIGENAKKGDLLHVEGSLQTREWTDKEKIKRYTTEVIARQVQLVGKKERPAVEPPRTEDPPVDHEPEVPEEDIPF